MPRKPKGNIYESRGRWYARVSLGGGARPNIALPTCRTEEQAQARLDLLVALAAELRGAKHASTDIARGLLERAGERDGKALADVQRIAKELAAGKVIAKDRGPISKAPTFAELAKQWTTGALATEYPDQVPLKKRVGTDVCFFENYINPLVGTVPIDKFGVEHAEAVMRSLPDRFEAGTRRQIAKLVKRVVSLAVYPLRLITANPIPPNFLPPNPAAKAKGWLYPNEDAQLLKCSAIPLSWRIFYGFLHREGPRRSEAAALTFADVGLERGSVTLDENKTDDPRAWALSPGVTAALRAWRELRRLMGQSVGPGDPVFVDEHGDAITENSGTARRFRDHLMAAGLDRPELFRRGPTRMRIRLHDTRATFITLALANGRTETWVQDRTGHRSSTMINTYRRSARTAAELGLGDLRPLVETIPELSVIAAEGIGGAIGGARVRPSVEQSATARNLKGTMPREDASDVLPRGQRRRLHPSRRPKIPLDSEDAAADSRPVESAAANSEASAANSLSPRAVLLAQLGEALQAATVSGDLEAARVAHEAIGKLLGSPATPAAVVDLATVRGKRGGR